MKKVLLPVLAALMMGFLMVSCHKERIVEFESMNTVWADFTVTNDLWDVDPNTGDLVCSMKWDVLTEDILKCGNVQVYFYEGVHQVPLPYSYPVTFTAYDSTNTPYDYVQPLTIRFDVEKGTISFLVTDYPIWSDDFVTDPVSLLTMRFRAVCTYPVNYIMRTKKQ